LRSGVVRSLRRPARIFAEVGIALALEQRDNALVTRVALRSVQRIFSLVGSKAGNPAHPVSLAKRDIEMVSHHVTLNWRQSAVRYLAAVTEGPPIPGHTA